MIASDLNAKVLQATKFEAPKTNQLLTEKLERDIDSLFLKWLGPHTTMLSQGKVYEIMTNIGVF